MIVCRDVHKWYGSFHAVRGVTTTIRRGEVVVVIGPSGSGKSTFLRTLNHLAPHQRGDIFVEGVLLDADTRNVDAVRRNIGMVSQSFDLFPHMSVLDNVILAPVRVRGLPVPEARDLGMELLERVGISRRAGKYPEQLSGGEQQRAAIARAMAMEPSIMLMDEPTWALDVEMVHEVLEVMRALARTGITMVIVSHQMAFSREAADRLVLFDEGQIVEDRPPADLLANPRHPRSRRFLERIL